MIISKTPIRVSFFGGGTDYPDFFNNYGGEALSTTIDKYIYITVKKLDQLSEYKYKMFYSQIDFCNKIEDIKHPVIKACLKQLNICDGIEIHVITDLPAKSGTGSSSSFTVGLLNAIYTLYNIPITKKKLAEDAINIEQNILNERVGVQDQMAAAYGGLNHLTFCASNGLQAKELKIDINKKLELQNSLLMFYTGITRYAHEILEEQIQNTKNNKATNDLENIKKMVSKGIYILTEGLDLNDFGKLLDEAWQTKKALSSAISNSTIDSIYELAINAGATGGKLLGAGGGGFLVFFVEQQLHDNVRAALSDYIEIPFNFENTGSEIIYSN
jgi:D-glycero-alpha-D-manno-heptose-7-phosphate kinase